MSLLPVVLLGATYFLLVEFGIRESYPGHPVAPLLRLGGGAIVLLFLMVAAGCGLLIADRLRRPIRAILGIAGDGEGGRVDAPVPRIPADPDTRRLLLRVEDLVHQKRAGLEAIRELEARRAEASEIVETLRQADEERGLPAFPVGAPASSGPDSLRKEIERFVQRLRRDMKAMEARIERLDLMLGNGRTAEPSGIQEAEVSLVALEKLAIVWSLKVEKARRDIPEIPGDLGSCFRDFSEALERLRGSLRTEGQGEVSLRRSARLEIAGLHESIVGWLRKDEKGAMQ